MKRLIKKSNHVSPKMHDEVQTQVSDPNGDRTKILMSKDEFVIAKRLLSELPVTPTSERTYELAQDIFMGLYEDISSIEDADNNWEQWKYRTMEILRKNGVIIS